MMVADLMFILMAFAAIALLLYAVLSLMIYLTATMDVNVDVSRCAEGVLPDGGTSEWFDKTAEPLLREGFVDHGYWMLSIVNNVQTVGTVLRWMYHPASSTHAVIERIKTRGLRAEVLTMSSSSADNRDVATSNSKLPKLFSEHPSSMRRHLPRLKDPAVLFRAHQLFCAASGFGPCAAEYETERFPSAVRAGLLRAMERQSELGIYRAKNSTTFTVTEWGALVLGFRSMPGVKQWRRRREWEKASVILRAAGVI